MVVLEMKFLSGRFHATPWGRNVNEGMPEWPPSPYRLARAVMDIWRRRFPDWQPSEVMPILDLFSKKAVFSLPDGVAAHTRSFLSSNKKDREKKQLVFDAFVCTGSDASLLIGFDGSLPPDAMNKLRWILAELNYFGRSESWVAVCASSREAAKWNCVPADGGIVGRMERVACLRTQIDYNALASDFVQQPGKKKKNQLIWLDAICMSSEDLLREGWSDPPALEWANYSVPAFKDPKVKTVISKHVFSHARYALSSAVLPRVEETVSFAERVRLKLMGIHRRRQNGDPSLVSPVFSGKGIDGNPMQGHQHAFFLPLDEDRDGWLDHILIASKNPFSQSELAALDRLRSVWQPDGKPDVDLVLISLSSEPPVTGAKIWVSATPFVTARHYRKGRGSYAEWLENEIGRECAYHGLPRPSGIDWIPNTLASSSIRWFQFRRSRKEDPPLRGYGCVLTFEEPVNGPFALGSYCHFGLGLFVANPEHTWIPGKVRG